MNFICSFPAFFPAISFSNFANSFASFSNLLLLICFNGAWVDTAPVLNACVKNKPVYTSLKNFSDFCPETSHPRIGIFFHLFT